LLRDCCAKREIGAEQYEANAEYCGAWLFDHAGGSEVCDSGSDRMPAATLFFFRKWMLYRDHCAERIVNGTVTGVDVNNINLSTFNIIGLDF
jgi:hypothetical protein